MRATDAVGSRQVDWWSTYEFALKHAAGVGVDLSTERLPVPGTWAWIDLPDGDARKQAALMLLGAQHALTLETRQQAECEASRVISAAADWSTIARQKLRHANAIASGAYIERMTS